MIGWKPAQGVELTMPDQKPHDDLSRSAWVQRRRPRKRIWAGEGACVVGPARWYWAECRWFSCAVGNSKHLRWCRGATGARDATGKNGWYYPVLFVNTFWQLKTHMTTLNSTVTRLPLHIDLNHLSNWKFSIISSIDEGAKTATRQAALGKFSMNDLLFQTNNCRSNLSHRQWWERIWNDQGGSVRYQHISLEYHNHR